MTGNRLRKAEKPTIAPLPGTKIPEEGVIDPAGY